ncbi:uncharacterized protein [Montipora foliosa]|uniref:uncharacterized protein isoform X1 n=1 Tax=Montipora foliosa TaxID=591990 RepID=UPI0035F1ABCC
MEVHTFWKILHLFIYLFASFHEVASHRQGSPSSLTSLGCYREGSSTQRIFSTLFHQVHVTWWWPDAIIQSCRNAAVAKGYRIFSIQNTIECRWGPNAERDYAKYGYGWYCHQGVGWYDSGSVYRITYTVPVNGHWTNWSSWSQCSQTCRGGTRSRMRSCTNPPPSNGGSHCLGPGNQAQNCGRNFCPSKVDGGWAQWSLFSMCSASCNGGVQIRSRTCSKPFPRHGGRRCLGRASEQRSCNTRPCLNRINGGWSPWQPWGSCSKTCDSGSQTRIRTCSNPPPRNGGRTCPGTRLQRRRCNSIGCPVNGRWSAWRPWGPCSRTCGGGVQRRTRTCTNPPPRNSGAPCTGRSLETRQCSKRPCLGCIEGRRVTDGCDRLCTCSGGRLINCARVRHEFTAMTTSDRTRYIRAVRQASTNPRYKRDYDQLITLHRSIFQSGIHERDHFLPWHRWFILQYENILRRIDCRITVPYWDWSLVSETPWQTGPSDLWFSGDSGFGANGENRSPRCVIDGPFRRGIWNVVPSAGNGCLERQFNLTQTLPDTTAISAVQRIPPSSFDDFEISMRINLHDTVHCLIGGHMCSFDSAVAPEFALHHSFLDKLWMDWQRISGAHLNAHFSHVSANMPGTGGLHPRDVIDNSKLPRGVKVDYQGTHGPQLQNVVHGPKEVSSTHRRRFAVLNEKAIRLFNVSKAEVEKAKRLGLKLLSRHSPKPADQARVQT